MHSQLTLQSKENPHHPPHTGIFTEMALLIKKFYYNSCFSLTTKKGRRGAGEKNTGRTILKQFRPLQR